MFGPLWKLQELQDSASCPVPPHRHAGSRRYVRRESGQTMRPLAATGSIHTHPGRGAGRATAWHCPSQLPTEQGTGLGLQDGNHVDGVQISGILFPFRSGKQSFVGTVAQVIDTALHRVVCRRLATSRRHRGEATGKRFQQTSRCTTAVLIRSPDEVNQQFYSTPPGRLSPSDPIPAAHEPLPGGGGTAKIPHLLSLHGGRPMVIFPSGPQGSSCEYGRYVDMMNSDGNRQQSTGSRLSLHAQRCGIMTVGRLQPVEGGWLCQTCNTLVPVNFC